MPAGRSPANLDPQAIRNLIDETRVNREALHDLILRIRHDRSRWERSLSNLAKRTRLTAAQRHRFARTRNPADDRGA